MFSGWLAPMVAISWLFLILRVVHEESLGWVNSPSILVGHSYGGSVITWQTGAFRETTQPSRTFQYFKTEEKVQP
jgi:hypothetical protein